MVCGYEGAVSGSTPSSRKTSPPPGVIPARPPRTAQDRFGRVTARSGSGCITCALSASRSANTSAPAPVAVRVVARPARHGLGQPIRSAVVAPRRAGLRRARRRGSAARPVQRRSYGCLAPNAPIPRQFTIGAVRGSALRRFPRNRQGGTGGESAHIGAGFGARRFPRNGADCGPSMLRESAQSHAARARPSAVGAKRSAHLRPAVLNDSRIGVRTPCSSVRGGESKAADGRRRWRPETGCGKFAHPAR